MVKTVIIIGAGIAGLSVGCYLQMNGFSTQIYEQHNIPGGCATSWNRKGYHIGGSIHGLVGSSPSSPMYKIWNEIVDMEKVEFHNFKSRMRLHYKENGDFKQIDIPSNINDLQDTLLNISPEDKSAIDEFINAIRYFQKSDMFSKTISKPREFYNILDVVKMIPQLPTLRFMKKWYKLTANQYSKHFSNPILQKIVKNLSSPILFEILVLAEMDRRNSGFPIEGALEFSKMIEKTYLELGGKIFYNKRVVEINVSTFPHSKQDFVTGISLQNGETINVDIVISAMDGKTIIYKMLNGKYLNNDIKETYGKTKLNPSRIFISLGLTKRITSGSGVDRILLEKPLLLPDGTEIKAIDIRIFDFNSFAPEGKTLVNVEFSTHEYAYWAELREKDREIYKKKKQIIVDTVIENMEKVFGEIIQHVDMVDVATPATFHRYTSNWKGSIQGWDNENIFSRKFIKKELPNLKNFYMTGQWVQPGGGVPAVFLNGRDLAKIICKRENQEFSVFTS
ncbi:MAG: NAD(P)/FAD-dependent oxidoreductase [Candidatus Heimdallarchaeota archaeon]|nr:MAG: NAD(P)/FAD-dependent oxidoreductase [Candidatus Heimdallarchaeota archaeon]